MTPVSSFQNRNRKQGCLTGIAIILGMICIGVVVISLLQNAFARQASSEATSFFATRTIESIIPTLTATSLPVRVPLEGVCSHNGKRVTVRGILGVSALSTFCYGTRCGIQLTSEKDPGTSIEIQILQGSGQNQMEPLPDDYTEEDLLVHTDGGGSAGAGDTVDITGIVAYADCGIQVDTVSIPREE